MMPRNPIEANWLIQSAEEEAARAARWAAVAQQQMAYQAAMAKAHAADAAGLRALWTFAPVSAPGVTEPPTGLKQAVAVEVPPLEPVELPKCQFCGKSTRIWQGRPQKFCSFPKTDAGYSCAARFRDRRVEEIRKSARAKAKAAKAAISTKVSCVEIGESPLQEPACLQCGKPTRVWRGKPQKFCSPPAGRNVSPCAAAFHDQGRRAKSSRRNNRTIRQTTKQPEPVRPSGSVLATASPRGDGHDLLATVTCAVSTGLPDDLRSEIISETILLMIEGAPINDALAQASKSVRKNAAPLRYTKPIDDCFWLAAETPD